MRNPIEIEDIEEMRCQEGIDDVELRDEIRGLEIGDHVWITFLTRAPLPGAETLLVRITRISGAAFRGKLAGRPTLAGLSALRVGSPVVFTTNHIHSLSKKQPPAERQRPSVRSSGRSRD